MLKFLNLGNFNSRCSDSSSGWLCVGKRIWLVEEEMSHVGLFWKNVISLIEWVVKFWLPHWKRIYCGKSFSRVIAPTWKNSSRSIKFNTSDKTTWIINTDDNIYFHYQEFISKRYWLLYLDSHGSILQGLTTQLSLGNDQFPKSMIEANSVLSNHWFDHNKNFSLNNRKPNMNHQSTTGNESEIALAFVYMEGKCFCCGKTGHKSNIYKDTFYLGYT